MSFDVSMRLRLDYKDRDARRAEKDLKDLRDAANRLNGQGAGKLERELSDVSRNARSAAKSLELPAQSLSKLNGLKTDRVEGELNTLKAAAGQLSSKLELPAKKIRALNKLKTDPLEAELRALGKAATNAAGDLDKIDRKKFSKLNGEIDKSRGKLESLDGRINAHTAVNAPATRLTGVMTGLGTAATNAFTGFLAFASVDNIVRGLNQLEDGFNQLDDAATRVAVTAEMLAPEAVEEIKASNKALTNRQGQSTADVNAARNVFAAANFSIERQNAVLGPTVDAAFAAGADPQIIAQAVLSGINSLGLSEKDIPAFLDQIVKGGKEGEFEIEAMARYFPEIGALYSASGRTGLDASAELIALAQVVRKGAGTESAAATNLQNLLSKISSPDTVKNFKEKGVSLQKLAENAQASGTPYILALLDQVERLTGGDEFKVGELFGDMQAKAALRPLLGNRELYEEIFNAVRNQSKGVVQADADFIAARPKAEADRRGVAWGQLGARFGELWSGTIGPVRDEVLGWLNPDWRRSEAARSERLRLKGTGIDGLQADIADIEAQIGNLPKPQGDMPDLHGSGRLNLELRLRALRDELHRALEAQGNPSYRQPGGPAGDPLSTPLSGGGPDWTRNLQEYKGFPNIQPDMGPVTRKLEPAGAEAGARFAEALKAEAEKAGATADQLKARFSFTATPTIKPSFSAVPGPLTPIPQRGGARPDPGPAVIHQTINGSADPMRTARYATREQNRAIRRARNRALHDLGAFA